MTYTYSFCVWPEDGSQKRHSRHLFDWFRMGAGRVDMNFTEGQFHEFRLALLDDGFTLREIERTPYVSPTPVL